jgi:hypothetical protein
MSFASIDMYLQQINIKYSEVCKTGNKAFGGHMYSKLETVVESSLDILLLYSLSIVVIKSKNLRKT